MGDVYNLFFFPYPVERFPESLHRGIERKVILRGMSNGFIFHAVRLREGDGADRIRLPWFLRFVVPKRATKRFHILFDQFYTFAVHLFDKEFYHSHRLIYRFVKHVHHIISGLIASMAHSDTIWKVPARFVISSEIQWDNVFPGGSVWVIFKSPFSHLNIARWAALPDTVACDITVPFYSWAWAANFLSLGNGGLEISMGGKKQRLQFIIRFNRCVFHGK